jgi:hypothetical protein
VSFFAGVATSIVESETSTAIPAQGVQHRARDIVYDAIAILFVVGTRYRACALLFFARAARYGWVKINSVIGVTLVCFLFNLENDYYNMPFEGNFSLKLNNLSCSVSFQEKLQTSVRAARS